MSDFPDLPDVPDPADPFGAIDIPKPPDGWWEQVPVLHELYKLLSSHEPVNWELARQVGVALATYDEQPIDDRAQSELDALTRAASVEAEEFSGLVAATVADVYSVTRAEWVEANVESFKFVMNPLAQKLTAPGDMSIPGAGQILTQISGVFMGLQTGFVLGYMGRHIIGQYELPLPAPSATRLFYVIPNLVQMERDWELDPKQFRYWVALHEITHHLQFSKPWVQSYFRDQVTRMIDSLDFDPTRMQGAFEGLDMLDPERMAAALNDPDRIIQAAWTPQSQDAMKRLQAFMTTAEGYATFVMDAVGARVLSDHARLKEAMERRKAASSPGEALLERLLGVELKRRQYEDGVKFCRYVAGVRDVASLNHVWENAESLPTTEEIADPDAWIARVL